MSSGGLVSISNGILTYIFFFLAVTLRHCRHPKDITCIQDKQEHLLYPLDRHVQARGGGGGGGGVHIFQKNPFQGNKFEGGPN